LLLFGHVFELLRQLRQIDARSINEKKQAAPLAWFQDAFPDKRSHNARRHF
jgi:hypothetical protein